MLCPYCHREETRVLDSRVVGDGFAIRRRRTCESCQGRFSTMEQMELLNIQVEKRSGELQSYSRDKLTAGLRRALEKRPVDDEKIDRLVSAIERDVQKLGQGVVSSTVIGEIVMRHLRKTDQIAYIRFASVYRSFEDLETFREELIKIIPTKQKKSSTI